MEFNFSRQDNVFRQLTKLLLAITFVLFPLLSLDYGAVWDAPIRAIQGEINLQYFLSGFSDQAALDPSILGYPPRMEYYGAFFDTLSSALQRILPFNELTLRHMLNALCGWLILFFTVRMASELSGPGAGLAAGVLLLISPRFIGHSMNNPKDIPFAAMFLAASFYALRFTDSRYVLKAKDWMLFTVFSALCLAVRAGALLLPAYMALVLAFVWGRSCYNAARIKWRDAFVGVALLLVSTLGILVLGSLPWPWALQNPLVRPIEALLLLGHYPQQIPVLFMGKFILSTDVPWNYVLVWIGISTPILVLVLFFFGAVNTLTRNAPKLWFVLFFALFPVAYAIISQASLYDGWRHLLFVYPFMVVVAALGMCQFVRMAAKSRGRMAVLGAALLLGLYDPTWFMIRNHPNEVLYFNQLVRGVEGANGFFDLDYFGNSYHQAGVWLDKDAERRGVIAKLSSIEPNHIGEMEAKRLDHVTWDPDAYKYGIYIVRLPLRYTGRVVHMVTVDGVPISLVLENPVPISIDKK